MVKVRGDIDWFFYNCFFDRVEAKFFFFFGRDLGKTLFCLDISNRGSFCVMCFFLYICGAYCLFSVVGVFEAFF